MTQIIFVSAIALILAAAYAFGFTKFPHGDWQFAAAVPVKRKKDGWKGVNLTWYGIICAASMLFGAALFCVLVTSVKLPLAPVAAFLALVLSAAVPSAKIVARIVERKKHTLSVGAALFVGVASALPLLEAQNFFDAYIGWKPLPFFPVMAAAAIAYTFSEGIGRLACLSFGCCYGRRVSSLEGMLRTVFGWWHIRFEGKTKKISYASGWEGKKVVPIQMITSIVCALNGLAGTALFLRGEFRLAFAVTIIVTLVWRVLSEFLRSDFRGAGTFFSAYSLMSLLAAAWCAALTFLLHENFAASADVVHGLRTLWNPGVILGLELLALAVFLYTGISEVTGSEIRFFVYKKKI